MVRTIMLKKDNALKLYVVGHTDGIGQFAHNVRLSQDRAAAGQKSDQPARH